MYLKVVFPRIHLKLNSDVSLSTFLLAKPVLNIECSKAELSLNSYCVLITTKAVFENMSHSSAKGIAS